MEKFARKCDATGRGMNEGYVVGDGELYFAEKEDLIKHLRTLNWEDCDGNSSLDVVEDDDLMEFFYNEDQYYYTEWDEYDIDDEYYDAEGNEFNN
jgi:hypothetical protein